MQAPVRPDRRPCPTFPRLLLAGALLAAFVPSLRAAAVDADTAPLDLYVASVDAGTVRSLVAAGFDVAGVRAAAPGTADSRVTVDLVLSPRDHARLTDRGIDADPWRTEDGLTLRQVARAEQEEGDGVWRSFDQAGGIRDELYDLAREHPSLVELSVLGTSLEDRDILAARLTADAPSVPEGTRPAALFLSTQHAREWIGLEVNRRLLHRLVAGYPADPTIRALLDSTEVWFVLVVNPDGYQRTHDIERMWRLNVRDNDGDGLVANGDGVDLNRNFDAHWGYDDDGSSPVPGNETYRGASPASEPETAALQALLGRIDFAFTVSWHSVAELILFPVGWQTQTPSADDPVFRAIAGTPERPAIEGFRPVLSADLYPTNGETCDYAYSLGSLCLTPELSDQGSGRRFEFPDDEGLVEAEFQRVLPFAMDVALSAADPSRPVSHLGNTVAPFYLDPFPVSYGDPQTVHVNALRRLGDVTVVYRIDDGPEHRAATRMQPQGERYGQPGRVYRWREGQVSGASPGDTVTVWFEGGGERSASFSYVLASDTGAPVLVLAAEDYTGVLPTRADATGPRYLTAYLDALAASGVEADVYDVDARGRIAASPLGVLSHYRAVIWYTGDDIAPRAPGMQPGTASRLANDEMLAVRDYLNAGGKVLYTGKYAGWPYFAGLVFDPADDAPCRVAGVPVACEALSSDFARFYLGLGGVTRSSNTRVEPENLAGDGHGWWAGDDDDADHSVSRVFDLAGAAAPVTASFDAFWNIRADVDYGTVEVSSDAEIWTPLADLDGRLTDRDPDDRTLGRALTGFGRGRLRFDLSPYVGQSVWVRLRYVTDRWTTYPGWFVDNLSIDDATGRLYADDLEAGFEGWTNTGWSAVPFPPAPASSVHSVVGLRPPFDDLGWSFGSPGATNQDHTLGFTPTSSELPADTHPQFASHAAAWYDDPARRAHTGSYVVHSNGAVYSFQRLTRTVDLTAATSPTLSLWISHDLRAPYDAVFVEARTPGGDDWTTLPESAGHTRSDTGLGCTSATWFARFPRLAHYMTPEGEDAARTCRPTGSTGAWYAASGDSTGWQPWSFDLSAYAGRSIDVSISVVTSRSPSPGARIDDVAITGVPETSFEDGWGGWTAEGAPEGSRVRNATDFVRATLADGPSGAVVVTPDSITFGFGFEGIADRDARDAVMQRVLAWFGIPTPGPGRTLFLPVARQRTR